jgi:hypothetical protein
MPLYCLIYDDPVTGEARYCEDDTTPVPFEEAQFCIEQLHDTFPGMRMMRVEPIPANDELFEPICLVDEN